MEKQKDETIGFLDKVKQWFTGSKSVGEPLGLSFVENYVSEYNNIENINSFYSCISKISAVAKSIFEITQTINSQNWKIKSIKKDKIITSVDPGLKRIIEKPYKDYDFNEFNALLIMDLLIAGNAWIYRERINRFDVGLRRIDPRYISRFNGVWEENNPYGMTLKLDPKFLTHVKYLPDPYDPVWGRGIIASNIKLIQNALRMIEFRDNFYKNGCFPGGMFSIENGGVMDEIKFKQKIKARQQGTENAGEPLVLVGKVTYSQTQLDPTTLRVSDEMVINSKEIMTAFGLPRYLMELGLRDGGQKYNNHALQHEHFIKTTIIPLAKKIEVIYNSIVSAFNADYKFEFDIHSEIYDPTTLQAACDSGTINRAEHRELLKIPVSKEKSLETHLVPSGLLPIQDVVDGLEIPLPPSTTPPPVGKNPEDGTEPLNVSKPAKKAVNNSRPREKSWRDEHYLSEPEGEVWTVDEIKKNKRRIKQDFINLNIKTRIKKTKEQSFKMALYLMESYGNIFANLAKNGDTIDALSKANIKKEFAIESIFDPDSELKRLEKITTPLFQSVGEATFANTANILTVAVGFNITDPGVADKINLLRKDGPLVLQTTKGKLTETLQAGISEGKTHAEIAKDIWTRFVDQENEFTEEFSKIYRKGVAPKDFDAVMAKGKTLQNRAVLIARTEVARANRLFSAESMRASEVVKTITIVNCEPGCPICGPHQNVEIDYAQMDDISNLHPNCSGSIVPGTISAVGVTL